MSNSDAVEQARRAAAKWSDNNFRRFNPRRVGDAFRKALYADMDVLQQEMEFTELLFERGRKAVRAK